LLKIHKKLCHSGDCARGLCDVFAALLHRGRGEVLSDRPGLHGLIHPWDPYLVRGAFSHVPRSHGRPSSHICWVELPRDPEPFCVHLVRISLTLVPTNSRNVPESLLIIPKTADESVKNRTPSISRRRESLIFWYSRTATSEPMSSILGMEILHLGATLVFRPRDGKLPFGLPSPISDRPMPS
jgi:hypothetical protein